ncbi:MAG: exodeoxyribonuclease VII large subunit [Gammaproteobacteria bacterium]|nr:exodeoxyribonuclease VII large subunit [Gammaproteobacteria bacterium]
MIAPYPNLPTEQPTQAFSVTEINTMIADLLSANLPAFLWVEGEISNLSVAGSGHRYLSLKDNGSTISCALFRGSANRISRNILNNLKNGDKVVVKASISVYKPRGDYQLIISDIEPAGFGALARAFAELKQKLETAGLTSSERKRPIPTWAKGIGVITSETGAAIRDILTTLNRRSPFIPISVYPTLVQGDNAPEQIINAINHANQNTDIDVIILARGGGSLEDLMAFNAENVAMAVVNSRLPIVTGVGHETDFTIVDFVSDYRAATPTAAAEIVSPDKMALQHNLNRQANRLQQIINQHNQRREQQLSALEKRLNVQHPIRQLQQQSQRLDEINQRMQRSFSLRLSQQKQRLLSNQQRLSANSPQQQLAHAKQQLQTIKNRLPQVMQHRLTSEQQKINNAQNKLSVFTKRLEQYQQQLKGLNARLTLLSPLGVLERGYSLTFDNNGQLVKSVQQLKQNDTVTVRLADGNISAIIK